MRLLWLLLVLPTLAQADDLTPAERTVFKTVLSAERAGFEQHSLTVWQQAFAPSAQWILGRQPVAGPHDIQMDFPQVQKMRALEYATPPGSQSRIQFMKPDVDLKADPPTLKTVVRRTRFGSSEVTKSVYTVKKVGKTWRILAVRSWPIQSSGGLMPIRFNDAFWLDADALLDDPGTLDQKERLLALIEAWRFKEAFAAVTAITARPEAHAQDWMIQARIALRLGDLKAGRRAARKAQKLDPSMALPVILK